MHFYRALFILFGAASTLIDALPQAPAALSPSAVSKLSQTHRIHQQAAGRKYPGPVAHAKAHAKHSGKVPSHIAKAAAEAVRRQAGHTEADPSSKYDSMYLSSVTVGADTLLLDFDTGSAIIWVLSTALPTDQQNGHCLYERGGTLLKGETYSVSYADEASSSGIVYTDTVSVGAVTATSQFIGAATDVSSAYIQHPGDGLFGLSFGTNNTRTPKQYNTFMDNVASSLPLPIFTATLRHQAPGEYDFGFIDGTKYTGDITYVALSKEYPNTWVFTSEGYSVGDGAKTSYKMDCIADTGSTLLSVDPTVARDYWLTVGGARYSTDVAGWIFPCNSSLPNFSLWMGGKPQTMPASFINYSRLDGDSTMCYGGLQSDGYMGICVVGDTFLKSQYVIFDTQTPQLGFAQQSSVEL